MPKPLTHDEYDVHVIDERITKPNEPPLHEVDVVLLEREVNQKTGDFIVIYPTGRKWWMPGEDFLKRWTCAIMHVLKEPVGEQVHPMAMPVPAGTRALPHAVVSCPTQKMALRKVHKGDQMIFEFTIAAMEGRIKMFGIEFRPDDGEDLI